MIEQREAELQAAIEPRRSPHGGRAMTRSNLHATSAFTPTAEVAAVMERATDLLQRKADIQRACEVQRGHLTAARGRERESTAARENLELSLAKMTDEDPRRAGIQDEAARHTGAISQQKDEIEQLERLAVRLKAEGADINDELGRLKTEFAQASSALQGEFRKAFEMKVKAALEPLISVLAEGCALSAALRSPGFIRSFLEDLTIPSLSAGAPSIIKAGRVQTLDRGQISLSETWQDEPSTGAIRDSLAAFTEISRRLAVEKPFEPVKPATEAKPYVSKQRVIHRAPGTPANESVTTVTRGSAPENSKYIPSPPPLEIHRTPGTPAPKDGQAYGAVRRPGTPVSEGQP